MRKHTAGILAAAVLACGSALPALAAGTYTWDGENFATDGHWDDATNWTANSGFPGTGDTAVFDSASTVAGDKIVGGQSALLGAAITTTTIDVNGTQAINTIQFSSTNTSAFVIGTAANAGIINLDAGGTITTAVPYNAANNVGVIYSALSLGGAATFSQTGSTNILANPNQAPLQIRGNIAGSGDITISGADGYGVLLAGNNSAYTGNIALNNGVLSLASANALTNSNTVTVAGVGTKNQIGWGASITSNYIIAGNASASFLGSFTESGTLTVNNGATFTVGTGGGNTANFAATLKGQGNFSATQGQMTLSGTASNTLSGTFTFSPSLSTDARNTLNLSKTGGAIAIAGPLTVQNLGMVKLNGNDEIANTVKPNLAGANTILKLNGFTQSLAGLTDGGVGTAGTVGNYHATNASTLTLALAGSNTFNGILANGGAGVLNVAVSGTGSQTLTGHSTYTGTTSITAGVLALADSASLGNTPISITGGSLAPRAGAAAGSGSASITLGGTGVFDMSADNGNTLGTFTLTGAGTALSLTGGGTMKLNLGSTLGNNDSLLVAGGGTASTSGTTLLDILTTGNASLTPGDYTLLSVAGGGLDPADFQFVGNTSTMNVVVGANAYTLSLGNSTSTAEILTVSATAVPEPATLGLLACGAMGLLVRRRRHA